MRKMLSASVAAVFVFAPFVASSATVSISVVDNAYVENSKTVPVGTTVVWKNSGMHPHTVTADNGSFTSGTMQPGQTYSRTFNTPGTYTYYCAFHPNMRGTIVVTGSQPNPPPQPNPNPQYYWCGSYYSFYPCNSYNYYPYSYSYYYPYTYSYNYYDSNYYYPYSYSYYQQYSYGGYGGYYDSYQYDSYNYDDYYYDDYYYGW